MQMWDTCWSVAGVDTVKENAHFHVISYLNIKQDVIIEYYNFYRKRDTEVGEIEKLEKDDNTIILKIKISINSVYYL